MRLLSVILLSAMLLPALAATAFSQNLPAPVTRRAAAVHPQSAEWPVQRVRAPLPAPVRPPSVDAVFQPAPQGLLDTPTALKYRRFLIELQADKSQRCPMPIADAVCPVADPFVVVPKLEPGNEGTPQPRITKTIRLKSANCREACRILKAKFAQPCLKLAGFDAASEKELILVAEPLTNSLLAIGTKKQLAGLQRAVQTLETQFQYEITVKRILPNGRSNVVARPRLVFHPGSEARIAIGQDAGFVLEMSVQVTPVKPAGFVKVYPHPQLTAINDRCVDGRITLVPPPAPGVGEEPAAIRTVAHTTVLTMPPAPKAEINRLRLQVRTYSVKDLFDGGDDRASAEALMLVIQTTVNPGLWDKNNGYGSIRYFDRTHALVIRQSTAGHRRISELLNQLRSIRNAR